MSESRKERRGWSWWYLLLLVQVRCCPLAAFLQQGRTCGTTLETVRIAEINKEYCAERQLGCSRHLRLVLCRLLNRPGVRSRTFLLHGLLCPGMAHMFSLVPRHGPTASKSWSARLLDGSVLAIRQMWHAYWHWRARQAMLMFLHSLDERSLKDFGVTQEEMHSFLDKQFTRARCQRSMRRWLC
jgi:uncharacterized protein YjiS (DUF1127 family)